MKVKGFIAVIIVVFILGCSPLVSPTTYQVPQIKKQGDCSAEVNANQDMIALHVAYSPLPNWVLLASSNVVPLVDNQHYNDHFTLGLSRWAEVSTKGKIFVALNYGWGQTVYTPRSYPYTTQIKFNEIQLQPYYYYSTTHFSVAFGARASLYGLYAFSSNDANRVNPGYFSHTIEPFTALGFGNKTIKFTVQAGYYNFSANTNNRTPDGGMIVGGLGLDKRYDNELFLGFGISYAFNTKLKLF